jgi:hypothetical protein
MKKFILPVFALALFTFPACEEDHNHGHVTITFLHPTNNEQIPLAQAGNVDIHVKFEWEGKEGEAVEVYLVAENQTNDVIIDFNNHQHAKVYEFEQAVNLSSYPAGTEFHLTAKGCEDHDCEEFEEASIHFTLVE